jgi:acyl transferase domain-containing protein/NAD(P)H-dependent flavin oxidoreductase YrpB (nitropropane dioxygenase family)
VTPPRYIVLTPPLLPDRSLLVAARRAGALGLLDLGCGAEDTLAAACAALAGEPAGSAGVRVADGALDVGPLLAALPDAVGTVVATVAAQARWQDALAAARARGVHVLIEVRDGSEFEQARARGADGFVARGLESGGWIGEETTFILLQRLLAATELPVWAHGGVGVHTAAACRALGASGVVLDFALGLVRESPLPAAARAILGRMDGSETITLGDDLGAPFRCWARPGLAVVEELRQLAARLAADARPLAERGAEWRTAVETRVGWDDPERALLPCGQDAAFAAGLARRFGSVGGVLGGLRDAADEHVATARRLRPLDADGPLARSHGTRYPVLQGPMTRVSDVPAFAAAVAEAGGLPFLALALLRAPEVRAILAETQRLLGTRPWGIGILGFVPLELRQEQLAVVREFRPPFAIIAGGRPDQALGLEKDGISTYLHVPSPGLLRMFVEQGARRFIFEGRECGGHVGPRPSFVLWNAMIDVLLDAVPAGEAERMHVVFAGGIHDAASAAAVAAMAAPLAARGMKVGVLLGTAYLFTHEAVATGAIQPAFQDEAVRCARTVLLETGPGHATRCAATPFADAFECERRRLAREGRAPEEIREVLEELNLGRLRIASKGLRHNPRATEPGAPRLVGVEEHDQRADGMYMIGQLASLRREVCPAAELHREVTVDACARIELLVAAPAVEVECPRPADVAVIGMACMLPKAPTLDAYWANILNRVEAITEIPADRFDWRLYFDPDPKARDKIYARWGGFLEPVAFDVARFGMPPASLGSIEPVQLLVLEAVRRALDDAGYATRDFDRHRTGVVVGVGGGVGDLGNRYGTRAALPVVAPDAGPEVYARLPEWTEDSFAGIIANVTAGRVANRFDLHGVNFTVDAACASSLAALYAAVHELSTGGADTMIVAGADTVQNPFGFLCFAKTRALSPHGRCRAFDDAADGTVISEGVAVVVLKRLADAQRDGDRIYGVIKAVAGASDGRGLSMTAPSPDGQVRALERAYRQAGCSPASVGLVEAHGTGTVAGDQAEIASLTRVFTAAGAARHACAVGSVKSMIGHTKCAAGLAGLIKAVLAVHHRVLPPTLGVERPNAKAGFDASPFYVNSEARPWIAAGDQPRRAGVSSFGFGGTNFHVVVEEYADRLPCEADPPTLRTWPAELVLVGGASAAEVLAEVDALAKTLERRPLVAIAAGAWSRYRTRRAATGATFTLAVVATSPDDLGEKLALARTRLADGAGAIEDPRGVWFHGTPLARGGRVAFLLPGQGSQYPDMLRELALHFPEVRGCVERASAVLADRYDVPLASRVFPPPRFTDAAERAAEEALTRTEVAQPALGAADLGMARLLATLGVRPDAVAGHSYGEYAALAVAGALGEDVLYALSEARGRAIVEEARADLGTMAAVQADRKTVAAALGEAADVWIANENAPTQTVVSGTRAGIAAALERLPAAGLRARAVPVACGFHSPLMAPAAERFAARLAATPITAPTIPVFSNTTAVPHPDDPAAIRATLAEHLVRPVRFVAELEAMWAAGCRLFVEVGPKGVLTALARETFRGRPVATIATDLPARPGLVHLLHALGQLAAHGVAVELDRLFAGRTPADETERPLPPTAWLVSGGSVRPAHPQTPVAPPAPAVAAAAPPRVAPDGAAHARPAPAAVGNGRTVHAAPASPVDASVRHAAETPATAVNGTANGHPDAVPRPLERPGADEEVLVHFQRTMSRFLDVQRSVMLAWLGQADAAAVAVPAMPLGPAVEPAVVHPAAATRAPAVIEPAAVDVPPGPDALAVPAALDEGAVREALLRIASERTGYPADMLDLDANMEADLGIDSIKRVEILGALQEALPAEVAERMSGALETLTRAKTLRAIVEQVPRIAGAAAGAAPARSEPAPRDVMPAAPAPPSATAAPAAEPDLVPRCVVTAVDAPLAPSAVRPLPEGVILVVDDGAGVARAVMTALAAQGARVLRIEDGPELANGDPERYRVPLGDVEETARLVEMIRAGHGPIGGIVHLAALTRDTPAADVDAALARVRRDVKSLYHLVRAAHADLVATRDAVVLAVTGLGGAFGAGGMAADAFTPDAGLGGLVKTLALEWPGVRCRVLDVDPAAAPAALAPVVVAELAAADAEVEIGWRAGRRLALRVRRTEAPPAVETLLGPDAVVLVTGGARGITSAVAEEIGRRWRPLLVLVGRQPAPAAEESAVTAEIVGERELKATIIAQLRHRGRTPAPAGVEAEYRRLLRDRETRARLAAIRATGARVEYRQVDMADAAAVAALVDDLYATHGRLDGVIHGAGLIEDKLLADKTPASFDRVFDTKVASALALARALRPEAGLRFLAFFSSVTARWGNRGQGDYAAANDVLNKLAVQLDAAWPARVVALGWGPWAGSGMVSDAVARQFAERGVELVPPGAGVRTCLRELGGGKGESELVLGGGPWVDMPVEVAPAPDATQLPLLAGIDVAVGGGGVLELVRTFDPARDVYLGDHVLEGKAVVPAAVAAELMAEAAQAGWPDWTFAGLHAFRVLRGIVLTDGPRDVRLVARAQTHVPGERLEMQVDVELHEPGRDKPAYRATAVLVQALPEAPTVTLLDPDALQPFPLPDAALYREWLFHGPRFQCIAGLAGVAETGLLGRLRPSRPRDALAAGAGAWLLDPVLVDGGLQLALLYMRATYDVSALPAGFAAIRQWAPVGTAPLACHLKAKPGGTSSATRFDVLFVRPDGRLALTIEDLEATGSRALNRLMGRAAAAAIVAATAETE